MTKQTYKFSEENAKAELERVIEGLLKQTNFENDQARVAVADTVIEAYFEATGERPIGSALDKLGTFILNAYYKSKDQTKKNQPNAILSEDQYKHRLKRERSFTYATNFSADGKNHNQPIRSHSAYAL